MAEKLLGYVVGDDGMDVLGTFCLCNSRKSRDFIENKGAASKFAPV